MVILLCKANNESLHAFMNTERIFILALKKNKTVLENKLPLQA